MEGLSGKIEDEFHINPGNEWTNEYPKSLPHRPMEVHRSSFVLENRRNQNLERTDQSWAVDIRVKRTIPTRTGLARSTQT